MSDPFLILHKVRGEPAFDIAEQVPCPLCSHGIAHTDTSTGAWDEWPCEDCEGLGFWWIIPTSGHRAYPYWHSPTPLEDILYCYGKFMPQEIPMPSPWPDHYPAKLSAEQKVDLSSIVSALTQREPEKRRA